MPVLAAEIQALGPQVDPEEAQRAARVAFERAAELTRAYRITDPPLVHNAKVNMGLKPRGLCWQWADDMESRMAEEDFQTLDLHRAIANWDNSFRIDHSTLIISARGDSMFDGIVLDPWRKGGRLTTRITPGTRATWSSPPGRTNNPHGLAPGGRFIYVAGNEAAKEQCR